MGISFEGGVPWVVSNISRVRAARHHRPLITAYLMVMVRDMLISCLLVILWWFVLLCVVLSVLG